MELSHSDLVVLFVLVVAATGLLALAPRIGVPYPILLVLGGLGLGLIPGIPALEIPPEAVLVGILPPLLYSAAFFTSLRDLRANTRPIGLLAIGLVFFTVASVALVAHELLDLSWPAAFALGAVVSPTDPIAATSIASRLGLPRRIVAIVEGESLVNDGTALVAYKFAIGAMVGGTISLLEFSLSFVWTIGGGVLIGLGVGRVLRAVRRRLNNPPVEITIALVTGWIAYVPAELAGASGVLAVVTAGVYVGWYTPELTTVETRLQGDAFWSILTYVLNALLFILVGLQAPVILDALSRSARSELILQALLILLVVIVVRIVWVFPATYLPRWIWRPLRERDPYPPWQVPALISWTGMRGAVSLAAALAVPLETDDGAPLVERNTIIFVTFVVILGTLVLQGLSLPAVIRRLGLEADGLDDREELKARIRGAEAALARIEELADEDWVRDDTAERLRGLYRFRQHRFQARFDDEDDGTVEERSADYQRVLHELLEAERQAVVNLRGSGHIGDEAMRRVLRDIDLEEARLDL
jgi:monovalent cation/hydrogen antiporter